MNMETFIRWFEIIGTIAFSLSGAMKSFNKEMDIFGVCILGLTTATAGGLIRDLILGITPPVMFTEPIYALVAIATALIAFIPPIRSFLTGNTKVFDIVLLLADSAGLGIFAVCGMRIAMNMGYENNFLLSIFAAMLPSVGGGVIRDVFAGDKPYIFVKDVYASAALLGAIVCRLLWNILGQNASMLIGFTIIICIRLLSTKYRWSLPKVTINNENQGE